MKGTLGAHRKVGRRRRQERSIHVHEEEQRHGISLPWYIIGLSILLVAGLSFVNFLAIPDMKSPLHVPASLRGFTGGDHSPPRFLGNSVGAATPTPASDFALRPLPSGFQTTGGPHTSPLKTSGKGKTVVIPAGAGILGAVDGGVAVFMGDSWLKLPLAVDAEEITFGAWIYLPNVPVSSFPSSSESMKTVASTKISGCSASSAQSEGWALFVHEWGTTNGQLRLSWTTEDSACTELFSANGAVAYDRWTLVGFSLSKARNCGRLLVDGAAVADTCEVGRGLGSLARAGRHLGMEKASIRMRRLSLPPKAFIVGAHAPHSSDQLDAAQSHAFLGYLGDVRLLHLAPESVEDTARLLGRSEDLMASERDAIKVEIHFAAKDSSVTNLIDGMSLSFGTASTSDVRRKLEVVSRSKPPRRPFIQLGEDDAATPLPGPKLSDEVIAATWPTAWTARYSAEELLSSQREADIWADEARQAMRHSWDGYWRQAKGRDEVHPGSGSARDWCHLAVTLLDSLSTLWVMGLRDEFDKAAEWLDRNPVPSPGSHGMHSFFEINIRALGGLLGAHSLSGNKLFLDNAKRLADKMLPAFDTASGLPKAQVDVGTGEAKWHSWVNHAILAEVATIQLEFRYLSHATNDIKYKHKADKALDVVLAAAGGRGLVPIYLGRDGAQPGFVGDKVSFGAMGDSYYEYLLKLWLQTGKEEGRLKTAWVASMKAMIEKLVKKTAGGLTYVAELEHGHIRDRMDHLACFVAGMLVMGSRTLPKEEVDRRWEDVASGLTDTCYEMYKRSPTGLSPEYVQFHPDAANGDMSIPSDAPHNLLRPEAAEAIFYMHYYTGDPKYRRMAHDMLAAFRTHCKDRHGYSAIRDVRHKPSHKSDSMESFWLAETLKYLYLTFAPRNTLSLEEYVFNTEAHPLRMWTE